MHSRDTLEGGLNLSSTSDVRSVIELPDVEGWANRLTVFVEGNFNGAVVELKSRGPTAGALASLSTPQTMTNAGVGLAVIRGLQVFPGENFSLQVTTAGSGADQNARVTVLQTNEYIQ